MSQFAAVDSTEPLEKGRVSTNKRLSVDSSWAEILAEIKRIQNRIAELEGGNPDGFRKRTLG